MLNNWTGMGRLTKDPEMRTTNTGKFVATFTIAVDRDFDRDKTDFISCVVWGKTAEFVNHYFKKGQLVAVSGSLQSRDWKDKNGNNRTSWEINASSVYFAESKKASADVSAAEFVEVDDREELPF